MTDVYQRHPRLYHYTGWTGLEGIISSNTLWATYWRALNDSTEVHYARKIIERLIFPRVKEVMFNAAHKSFSYKRYLDRHGGMLECAKKESATVVEVFHGVTFDDSKGSNPFAPPYVFSFCSHVGSGEYVQENGLLSQWRGYGAGGRFAIVFESPKLQACIDKEAEAFNYAALELGEVVYDDEPAKFEIEFRDLVEAIHKFIEERIKSGPDESVPSGHVFKPFFSSATLCKHQAFKEESEVRLTMAPLVQGIVDKVKTQSDYDPTTDNKPIKEPLFRQSEAGRTIPYIVFNATPGCPRLPIAKIIVGPQKNQDRAAQNVSDLLTKHNLTHIKISRSETPYIDFN